MEEIAKLASENPQKLINYISKPIFVSLIEILEKDSTNLVAASNEQIEARKKIIINELVKREALEKNEDIKNVELPFEITTDDINLAMALAPMEQAERNKEYAIYTLAILSKAYSDETKKEYNNTVPITDLPGISNIVNTLKNEKNPSVKIAAIDALIYLAKTEYNDEIKSILTMATQDKNETVAEMAKGALTTIEA